MASDLTLPSRDLAGYGANPPDPQWPGGARVAVNFCINYEEGAEMCVLNGDERSEVRVCVLNGDERSEVRVWITRREDIARHWMAVHPAG